VCDPAAGGASARVSYGMLAYVGRRMDAGAPEQSLRRLVDAIVANDGELFSKLMDGSSALAATSFSQGATRQGPSLSPCFIKEIGHYIYSGDTALHFAAASYRQKMADKLIKAGANVRARNRRGCEPLHAAAFGSPGTPRWDPVAQAASACSPCPRCAGGSSRSRVVCGRISSCAGGCA
jgi:hypothetical protein